MTKKEYLKCYRKACKKLDDVSKKMKILDCNIDIPSFDYAAPRVQASSNGDCAIINEVNRSMTAYKQRLKQYEMLSDLIHDINNSIENLEDDTERRLLDYRFRDNLTLSVASEMMNYSERHLRRIYNKALLHLDMPEKYTKLTAADVGLY